MWSVAQVKNISEKIVIAPQGAVGVTLIHCGTLTSIFFFHLFFLTRTTDCQKGGTAHGWYSWESPTKTDFIWTTFVLVIQTVEHGLTLEVLCVSSKVCWFRCREDFFSVDLHNFCFQPLQCSAKVTEPKAFFIQLGH